MFYVTSLDGSQVEPLHGWGTDFNLSQSVDGTLTVSSTVLATTNNPGYNVLASESVVTIDDLNFRVKQFAPGIGSKQFTAVSDFFDHNATWIHGIFSGSHTAANHAQFALAGTGWTAIIDSSLTGTNYINKFGDDSSVALIQKLCKYHQCEFAILPNKRIYLAKQTGPDNDYQFRYKYNVSDVVLKEDTSKLRTYIKGYGKDGLTVEYESPNAAIFGRREAEPVKDERFTDATALLNYIKLKLQDEPELAIESSIPELVNREIGERVWLFYEPLNVAMQTRILKQNKTLVRVDGVLKLVTSSVVFGNTLVKDAGDDIVEQQVALNEAKEEIGETIETTKEEINETIVETVREINFKFQETEEKIVDQYTTITSQYTASISANARQIRTEMSEHVTTINTAMNAQYNRITEAYNSSITQTAREIRQEVTASITSVNANIEQVEQYASSISVTAQQIQQQVSSQQTVIDSQGSRINYAESSITQQANQISMKVDVNGVIGAINLSPEVARIQARNIELVGAVNVLSDITGNLGTITTGNIDIHSDIKVGNSLYLRGGGDKAVRFATSHVMETAGGHLSIYGLHGVELGFDTRFNGNVDFGGANVTGLPVPTSVGGYTMSHSVSGGKTYMSFRYNGTHLGMALLTA